MLQVFKVTEYLHMKKKQTYSKLDRCYPELPNSHTWTSTQRLKNTRIDILNWCYT